MVDNGKEKGRIVFPAWFVMILLVVVGVFLNIITFLVPDTLATMPIKILIKAVEVIGSALVSVGILDFLLSISNENSLLERVQTKINKETNYQSLKSEHLKGINEGYTKAIIEDMYSSLDNVYKPRGLAEVLAKRYWETINSSVYISNYYRQVLVTLKDNNIISVTTNTDVTFVNAKDINDRKFYIWPMFAMKEEAESFKVNSITHEDTDFKKKYDDWCSTHPNNIDKAAINNNMYQFKEPFTLNIGKRGQHQIKLETTYNTCYALFFQTMMLNFNCKSFKLNALLDDQRSDRARSYMLRWEIITLPQLSAEITETNTCEYNGKTFDLMGNEKWLPKGCGYVLTLNEKS